MGTISLCMIAKNEEEWIGQAIRSVQPIVSEVIVVDTGSNDATREIARGLGAKVVEIEWRDDFAFARNISLQEATGDWILVLDADEAIAARDLETLQEMTIDPGICWEFLQRHYTDDHRISDFVPIAGEYPEWEQGQGGYFESNCVRFFPNRAGLNFQGRVHELVEHSIRELGKHRIVRTHVRIHHFGHTKRVRDKKKKGTLYTPLGETKAQEQPQDWKAFFELGVEHNNNGRYYESIRAFERSLELNPGYVNSWINLGYVLCELRRYAEAEAAQKQALVLEPGHPEALCNLGLVYLRSNCLPQAEKLFRLASKVNPLYINALCNLALTLAMQGRSSEAALHYQLILKKFPRCVEAHVSLGTLYLQSGVLLKAQKHLCSALTYDPKHSKAYYHLGLAYKALALHREAIECFERLSELQSERLCEGSLDAERFLALANQARSDVQQLMQ